MENTLVLNKQSRVSNSNKGRTVRPEETHTAGKLVSEVDENFGNYLSWHGLEKEASLILPSTQHYYYDYEELKSVKTLVNLKQLNFVNNLEDFLKTLCSGLSPETNFIGCFSDVESEKESLPVRFYRKFIDFIDARTNVDINKKSISRVLEANGFKVIDMTEINGLTYFRTKNLSRTA